MTGRFQQSRRGRRDEKGQALVLVAITMFVLLAFLVLLLDVGVAFARRRELQNGADAAAAAAVRVIALNDGSKTDADVKQAIDNYSQANGGDVDYASNPPYYLGSNGAAISMVGTGGSIPSGAAGVALSNKASVSTFFAVLLDRPLVDVAASGAAMYYPARMPASMSDLVPLGVPQMDFLSGASYDLWSPHYHDYYGVESEYKGPLNFTKVNGGGYVPGTDYGNKPRNMANWCAAGYDGVIALGNAVEMYSGDLGNNVADGLRTNITNQRLADAGGAYGIIHVPIWDNYDPKDPPRDAIIHVSGFAAFKVYLSDVNSSSVRGQFVSYIVPDGLIDASGGVSYGPKVVKLVRPTNPPVPAGTWTPIPTMTPTPTTTPAGTPTATPCPSVTVSGISFDPVGNSGKVDVRWSTNLASDSRMEWGSSPSYGSSAFDGAIVTSHQLQMAGIEGGVVYYYRISSKNSCGTIGQSTGTYTR